MSSLCISRCIDDARPPVMVARATFTNLYKWPESDAEFLRSVSSNRHRDLGDTTRPHLPRVRVVDSISCRQLYLRSYTFSRDDDDRDQIQPARTTGKAGRSRPMTRRERKRTSRRGGAGSRTVAALRSVFRRLLSCTAKVDVVG
ncbi:uncharacterized protein LOC124922327 [Impatiens glandulifera]|uniref:uncharacterized protein LOC124922327 n=1 Tax=Impatiens glandulifera TaxID=253017 RepID=UPI001FB09700|nr:uncharacterized protein LOC124922327 [Impatiens glandulifera]